MKTLLMLIALALCAGCSNLGSFSARYGDLSLVQGKDTSFDKLTANRVVKGTNGVITTTTITVEKYSSSANVDAMRAENERYSGIAKGASEGIAAAVLDKYGPPSTPKAKPTTTTAPVPTRVPLPSETLEVPPQ